LIVFEWEIKLEKKMTSQTPRTKSILRITSASAFGPGITRRTMLEIFVPVTNISEEMNLFLAGK
jgi:hypothetical protein